MLNATCTKGTASDTRNSYPRGPPKPVVWEKWLWRESGLNLEGEFVGNFEGNKGKVTPFQLISGAKNRVFGDQN